MGTAHGRSFDVETVRRAARGQWVHLLNQLGGLPLESLNGKHQECPKCGGKDRFKFTDMNDDGSLFCNQCAKCGDGFAALGWALNKPGKKDFPEIVAMVGERLNVAPSRSAASSKNEPRDPAALLKLEPLHPQLVAVWGLKKGGIAAQAVADVGANIARCLGQNAIAIPSWGPSLDAAAPVGWHLYAISGGKFWAKPDKSKPAQGYKVWTTPGSQSSIVADLERLKRARVVWKLEGLSDLLAFMSLPDLPDDVAGFTNASGCGEIPPPWMCELVDGKPTFVCHDCDEPGQKGALGYDSPITGRHHTGWAEALAGHSPQCQNVVLPYDIAPAHGKDLRDWIRDGGTYAKLLELAESATVVGAREIETQPIVAPDDPTRLARINVERYRRLSDGEIRNWKGAWFTWDRPRGYWQEVDERELRGKIWGAIEEEFVRLHFEEMNSGESEEPPIKRKVSNILVGNVLGALRSLPGVDLPKNANLSAWLNSDRHRNFIALENGILDLDAFVAGQPAETWMQPHTPDWFSTVKLPYSFDVSAECPKWMAFLERNVADPDKIATLQEWAGYLLTPDTGYHRYLVIVGEGANGKSVYCGAMEAMLGAQNCSHVSLEDFTERFLIGSTLGKNVNIMSDVGEIDRTDEGKLKRYVCGESMPFDRKHSAPIDAAPTARIMIACNSIPRMNDKSDGMARRFLPVPFDIVIPESERVPGMDKPAWWRMSGELPGIFRWALDGLVRLRKQRRFTEGERTKATKIEHLEDSNPARVFLREYCDVNASGRVISNDLYQCYVRWCEYNGNRPMNSRTFGREIVRAFPTVIKKQFGFEKKWGHEGIQFCQFDCHGWNLNILEGTIKT